MATGTVKNGDLIGIYINNTLIANGKDCGLDLAIGSRETTTKDDVGTGSFEPTKKTATLKGSFLQADDAFDYNQLFALAISRQKFTWKHGSVQSGDTVRSGTGFFTAVGHASTDNANITGSYSIQATGPITIAVNP